MVTSSSVSAANEKRGECAYVSAFLGTEEIAYGNLIPYLFTRFHAELTILQRSVHRAEVQYSFHENIFFSFLSVGSTLQVVDFFLLLNWIIMAVWSQ
ncbi:hypothetical protein FF1_030948 [Malus domestica]